MAIASTWKYKCLTSSGLWLGVDQSCDDIVNGPASGGTVVSTGQNNYLIGNLNTGYNPPVLYPLGAVVTSIDDYLEWISTNEPSTISAPITTSLPPLQTKQQRRTGSVRVTKATSFLKPT